MLLLQGGRLLGWLRYLLSGERPEVAGSKVPLTSLSQRRDARIKELEHVAEVEEGKVKELEVRLEFQRREHEVLGRIQEARSRRRKVWELLGEYGIRRSVSWGRLVVVGGFLLLMLLLFIKC